MAERSAGLFTVAKSRAAEAAAIFEGTGFLIQDGVQVPGEGVTFSDDEAGGGGVLEAERLKEAGIPYLWEWDAGISYGPGSGVFDGARGVEVPTEEGAPVARVDEDGNVNSSDLAAARLFVALSRKVVESIRAEESV